MIQVEGLTYTYRGSDSPVLKGIDFRVDRGEIFGFLGPSGAGKSTTQKVLNGLLRGYGGSVRVNGTNLSSLNRSFYEKIGVAFEFPNLYTKLTAIENLRLFASFFQGTPRDPEELLERVNLAGDRDTRVEAFSKGMKMRLNFIRSLLNEPDILFLDEPTAGLDPANARVMKDMILELQERGVTVFLTTHNMADAGELCNRIAFMVGGTLPVIDSTENLRLKHGRKLVRVTYIDDRSQSDGNRGTVLKDFQLDKLGDNLEFREVLQKEVQTIHTQEASLEEIFIKVTGTRLIP
jgi:fluoroquinolone transport system ATP-binding protein